MVLVSVHAKWGTTPEDIELRRRTYHAIGDAYAEITRQTAERDVVFLGDFNTNGCPDCTEPLSAAAEIEELSRVLAGMDRPFRVLAADAACTEYEHGRPWMLDHVVVPVGMAEAAGATAQVYGFCPALGCREGGPLPGAYTSLSDHCPVVVDLVDRDEDQSEVEFASWSSRLR